MRLWAKRLLAAVALQKIHRVDGDCVSANVVAVVVHVNLLYVFLVSPLGRTGTLPVGTHYITGITRLSFHYI